MGVSWLVGSLNPARTFKVMGRRGTWGVKGGKWEGIPG